MQRVAQKPGKAYIHYRIDYDQRRSGALSLCDWACRKRIKGVGFTDNVDISVLVYGYACGQDKRKHNP